MATTSLNPGVGPTNADIATAVAAPSAATIASAVAAPSAATIATAVAAAVPTTAGITTIVQANAGGAYSGTMTSLGYQSMGNVNSVTFTGLSGYKYLQFFGTAIMQASNAGDFSLRFNSDSSSIYNFHLPTFTPTGLTQNRAVNQSSGLIGGNITANNSAQYFNGEIFNSNSAGQKVVKTKGYWNDSGTVRNLVDGFILWNSTAAISSVTFFFNNGDTGNTATGSGVHLMGGN
jgi:hypothetical protein